MRDVLVTMLRSTHALLAEVAATALRPLIVKPVAPGDAVVAAAGEATPVIAAAAANSAVPVAPAERRLSLSTEPSPPTRPDPL
jgi:hypothetical protein